MKIRIAALATLALSLTSVSLQAASLRDIYELALENDAQLKSEEATYLAARETEVLGRSQLLPQVTSSYSVQNSDSDDESVSPIFDPSGGDITFGDVFTGRDIDTEGYRVSLNQAIFDLPAWFGFKSGKEITRQAEATFAANQQNLIVRVVEAYLAVLRAQDNLAASQAQERAFERQLEQTQQRFEVGLIAITDVYEAQAARDLAQVERIVDENNVLVAQERLSVLTGQRHENLFVLKDEIDILPPEPLDRAEWVDFALANNFQLAAARYREEAARQTAKAKRLEHAPKITGGIEYSDFDTDGSVNVMPDNGITPQPNSNTEDQTWQIALSLPLYSGGAISANRRRAAQEFNAAREDRINLTRNTVTNTRSLHMTVLSDVSRVAARKQSILSSRSALDATQAGYEVGTRNVVDVLNAQNALYSAERDYANSRYDYVLDMLKLKEQAGLLSPDDVIRLDTYLEPPPPPTASGTEQAGLAP
ncbi:MAG: TolC family outer membrane protein [Gammaproteobacteria bacterium]|jgi:outer membrane protein|nr:TolC family outer membrane protein [Gammaproteobacteria bacterium]